MVQEVKAPTIGFAGLGTKSATWIGRLLDRGYPLVVWDPDPDLSSRLVTPGRIESVREVVDLLKHTDALVCAVETGAEVEGVLEGPRGLLEAAAPNTIVMCLSTIDPSVVRRMDALAARRGVAVLDAALTNEQSGTKKIVKAYVGGDVKAYHRAGPLLSALADEVVHCGGTGNGLAMKHVVNMLAQVQRVLIVEALAVGSKAGIDLRLMIRTILSSKGNSVAFERLAARILDRNFEGVPMHVTCRDVAMQTLMARSLDMPVSMASAALQVYQTAIARGLGDRDSGALIELYESYMLDGSRQNSDS
jgi:3-hydroxyisobutyrate dehydrogenase-like beta-hydroxyacid dehydrogenase